MMATPCRYSRSQVVLLELLLKDLKERSGHPVLLFID